MAEAENVRARFPRRLGRYLRQSCARAPVRLTVFAVFATIVAWPLIETAPAMNTFRDAQYLRAYEDHAVRSVAEQGQFPLWDPYYCGGVYALGSPQSRYLAPTFVLSLGLGVARGAAVTVLVLLLMGMEGIYRYAREHGGSSLGAVAAAPVFAASGLFATAPMHGWIHFFGFELIPWALLGVCQVMRGKWRGALLAPAILAWMVGFGGTYAAPMAALLCGYEVVRALAGVRDRRRLARMGIGAGVIAWLALSLAAVRLWPIAETLGVAPRVVMGTEGYTLSHIGDALVGDLQLRRGEVLGPSGQFYVGAMALAVAIALAFRRAAIPWIVVALLAVWTATGNHYATSPYTWLRQIPVFEALRYPERYLIVVALVVPVLAAQGIRRLEARARRRAGWAVPLGVVLALLVANAVLQVAPHHAAADTRQLAPPPAAVDRPFAQARGNRWAAAYYAPMSRGSLSCFDDYPVPMSPVLRGDRAREEYLLTPSKGHVARNAWSPNRIALHAELDEPARVRINQNWHPGWDASVGEVVRDEGLLAVDVPAGTHEVVLRFAPQSAIGGAATTLVALGLLGWLGLAWWRGGDESVWHTLRRRGYVLALSVVPLMAVASLGSQPPWTPPSPHTPEGEDVFADAPPPEATPLNVALAHGLVLEAGHVRGEPFELGGTAMLELDWRQRHTRAPPGTQVFVHLQAPGGHVASADHRKLSSQIRLDQAPLGRTLRDVIEVPLPHRGRAGTWEVWAGLWIPGEHAHRLPVRDAGDAKVANHRIRVATFQVRSTGVSDAP